MNTKPNATVETKGLHRRLHEQAGKGILFGSEPVSALKRDEPKKKHRPGQGSGVDLSIKEDRVTIDLHVVAEPEANLLRLGQTLQNEVSRAIQDMVGMEVSAVNVHIQDVDFPLVQRH